MKEAREKYLKYGKRIYIAINAILIAGMVLSMIYCIKTGTHMIFIFVCNIFMVLALISINDEVHTCGLEKIVNSILTKKLLSKDHLTEVIPVNPPDDINFIPSEHGTGHFVDGYIHNELVNITDGSKFYAKIDDNKYIIRIEISRTYGNKNEIYYVGYIGTYYFPYFYEMAHE